MTLQHRCFKEKSQITGIERFSNDDVCVLFFRCFKEKSQITGIERNLKVIKMGLKESFKEKSQITGIERYAMNYLRNQ